MSRLVQSLEALENMPPSPLDEALTTLCGENVTVEPDDDIVVIHYRSTGEVEVKFPQLKLLSPGMLERSLPLLYRALMQERAGVRKQRSADAQEEIAEAFALVGPLDETSDESILAEATADDKPVVLEEGDGE